MAEGKVHTTEHDYELGKGDPGPLSLSIFFAGRNPFLIPSLFEDFNSEQVRRSRRIFFQSVRRNIRSFQFMKSLKSKPHGMILM